MWNDGFHWIDHSESSTKFFFIWNRLNLSSNRAWCDEKLIANKSGKDCAIKNTRHKSSIHALYISALFLCGFRCLAFSQFYEIFIILHATWNREKRLKEIFTTSSSLDRLRYNDVDFCIKSTSMTRQEPLNGNDVFSARWDITAALIWINTF